MSCEAVGDAIAMLDSCYSFLEQNRCGAISSNSIEIHCYVLNIWLRMYVVDLSDFYILFIIISADGLLLTYCGSKRAKGSLSQKTLKKREINFQIRIGEKDI